MLNIGEIYYVTIKDTNIFGNGICSIDGYIVFVEKALTGDVCEIEITSIHSSYGYAKIVRMIEPSKERITAKCQHFDECGGCCFLHSTIDLENRVKEESVKRALKMEKVTAQVGKIQSPVVEKYRNKVVLFYSNDGFGYMKKESTSIVPHESCVLNEDIFDKIANKTAELLKGTSVRALFMRKSSDNSQVMVCPILRNEQDLTDFASKITDIFPQIKTVLYAVNDDVTLLLEKLTFKVICGDGVIYDTICGLKFRISAESFYQVNPTCAELLYEKAIELAQLDVNSVCADLFCGTGTIGIISAKKTGATVYGVEIVKKAVEDAKYNANQNKVDNIYFEAKDAGKFNKNIDVAIIDPPRRGCSKFMISTLLRLMPQKIVYISCDINTQARDLRALSKCYDISSPVYPFNLFPRTSHIETVVCLERKTHKTEDLI